MYFFGGVLLPGDCWPLILHSGWKRKRKFYDRRSWRSAAPNSFSSGGIQTNTKNVFFVFVLYFLFTCVKTTLNVFLFYPFVVPQMYLVIFPEGTRYNPELKNVITDSQAFATKEGTEAVFCCTASCKFSAAHSVFKTADSALLRGLWSLFKLLQVFPINDFC